MSIEDERRELADHLAGLFGSRLVDPLEILLESDLDAVRELVTVRAATLAARILGEDEAAAAFTAIRIVAALYPGDGPFRPSVAWWGTPLGRHVARLVGHPGVESLSYAEAGAVLGVSRQAVHDLVVRGKLDRHPSGGVTNASVQARAQARFAGLRQTRQEERR